MSGANVLFALVSLSAANRVVEVSTWEIRGTAAMTSLRLELMVGTTSRAC